MPISVNEFSPTTTAESQKVNENFTTLINFVNNLRPTLYAYIADVLGVEVNASGEFIIKEGQTLTANAVDLSVKTAPDGADIIVDVLKNGSSIFSTKPQITDGQSSGGSSAVFSTTTFVAGDVITFNIDQVGSSTPGSDLTIALSFLF
jgi:hypothetical protein